MTVVTARQRTHTGNRGVHVVGVEAIGIRAALSRFGTRTLLTVLRVPTIGGSYAFSTGGEPFLNGKARLVKDKGFAVTARVVDTNYRAGKRRSFHLVTRDRRAFRRNISGIGRTIRTGTSDTTETIVETGEGSQAENCGVHVFWIEAIGITGALAHLHADTLLTVLSVATVDGRGTRSGGDVVEAILLDERKASFIKDERLAIATGVVHATSNLPAQDRRAHRITGKWGALSGDVGNVRGTLRLGTSTSALTIVTARQWTHTGNGGVNVVGVEAIGITGALAHLHADTLLTVLSVATVDGRGTRSGGDVVEAILLDERKASFIKDERLAIATGVVHATSNLPARDRRAHRITGNWGAFSGNIDNVCRTLRLGTSTSTLTIVTARQWTHTCNRRINVVGVETIGITGALATGHAGTSRAILGPIQSAVSRRIAGRRLDFDIFHGTDAELRISSIIKDQGIASSAKVILATHNAGREANLVDDLTGNHVTLLFGRFGAIVTDWATLTSASFIFKAEKRPGTFNGGIHIGGIAAINVGLARSHFQAFSGCTVHGGVTILVRRAEQGGYVRSRSQFTVFLRSDRLAKMTCGWETLLRKDIPTTSDGHGEDQQHVGKKELHDDDDEVDGTLNRFEPNLFL